MEQIIYTWIFNTGSMLRSLMCPKQSELTKVLSRRQATLATVCSYSWTVCSDGTQQDLRTVIRTIEFRPSAHDDHTTLLHQSVRVDTPSVNGFPFFSCTSNVFIFISFVLSKRPFSLLMYYCTLNTSFLLVLK